MLKRKTKRRMNLTRKSLKRKMMFELQIGNSSNLAQKQYRLQTEKP
jgi:hypothetical protein